MIDPIEMVLFKIKHPSLPKQNWLGLHSTLNSMLKARSPAFNPMTEFHAK